MYFWETQKIITSFYACCAKPVCEKYGLTQMELDILLFLKNNPPFDTAAQIIKMRRLTKSHVSGAVKALQEKGLLTAGFREGNHKEIHLCITPQALPVVEDGLSAQETFGRRLFSGFSAQEGELCQQLYRRICQNAREGLEENEEWNS